MAGQPGDRRKGSHSALARRHRQERRRLYLRRRLAVLILALILLVGLYYGLNWVLTRLIAPSPTPSGGPAAAVVPVSNAY